MKYPKSMDSSGNTSARLKWRIPTPKNIQTNRDLMLRHTTDFQTVKDSIIRTSDLKSEGSPSLRKKGGVKGQLIVSKKQGDIVNTNQSLRTSSQGKSSS